MKPEMQQRLGCEQGDVRQEKSYFSLRRLTNEQGLCALQTRILGSGLIITLSYELDNNFS